MLNNKIKFVLSNIYNLFKENTRSVENELWKKQNLTKTMQIDVQA